MVTAPPPPPPPPPPMAPPPPPMPTATAISGGLESLKPPGPQPVVNDVRNELMESIRKGAQLKVSVFNKRETLETKQQIYSRK